MISNLPPSNNATTDTREFFDKFFKNQVSFPANEIDAAVGFFMKRGFDTESARSTDGVQVFQLLDTMKSLTDVQLSQIVAQVLNSYREKTSILGYRIAPIVNLYETRNILV